MHMAEFKSIPRPAFLVLLCIILFAGDVTAQVDYTERDYMSERRRRFHGTQSVPGLTYHISRNNKEFVSYFTFEMNKDSDILVQIRPMSRPSSVAILVSEPTSLRDFKMVWSDHDLREPVRFWTSSYWTPRRRCNNNVCSKIRFQAIEGDAEFQILRYKRLYPLKPHSDNREAP